MIQRDAATELLKPLAAPTLAAFGAAKQHSEFGRKATAGGREVCSPIALALLDGISFWSYFAGELDQAYGKLPQVDRMKTKHPLTNAWLVSDKVCVRMRSDIAGVDVEQLSLFDLESDVPGVPELVALTWGHSGPERFAPTFVHFTDAGQAWRIPVATLDEQQPVAVPVKPPTPKLSSSRTDRAKDAEQASGDESR
jgi:hypothetical protein